MPSNFVKPEILAPALKGVDFCILFMQFQAIKIGLGLKF